MQSFYTLIFLHFNGHIKLLVPAIYCFAFTAHIYSRLSENELKILNIEVDYLKVKFREEYIEDIK